MFYICHCCGQGDVGYCCTSLSLPSPALQRDSEYDVEDQRTGQFMCFSAQFKQLCVCFVS